MLKKGMVVKIFTDPFTEENLEGTATLIKRVRLSYPFEEWIVRFTGEDIQCYRAIHAETEEEL